MPEPVLVGIGKGGDKTWLSPRDRSTHMHVVGASGRGKSKFLEGLIRQDIKAGHGLCLIDPHGTLYDDIVRFCAYHGLASRRTIHLIDPNLTDWVVGFDPLRCEDPEFLSVVVDAAVDACAQVWGGEDTNATPLLKKCLRATFMALASANRPFADALILTSGQDHDGERRKIVATLTDPIFRRVWEDFLMLRAREYQDDFKSTVNRLVEFLGSPIVRRMLSQKERVLDLQTAMAEGHIILVNLRALKTSRNNARVIGTLLTNALFTTALRRSEREAERRPFYLYIDECYRFVTSDIESMLDETRKFGLHVILSHQHLAQLRKHGEAVFNAVMTNAQTRVVFGGLSETDAEFLAKEVLRETFDYNRSKTILEKPTVVGYDRIWLRNTGTSFSESESHGTGDNIQETSSSSSSDSRAITYDPWGLIATTGPTGTVSTGQGTGQSRGRSSSYNYGRSSSRSEGESESLIPIFEILPTAVEGQEEIMNRAILKLRRLNRGLFVLQRPSHPPIITSAQRIDTLPVRPDRIALFSTTVLARSPYTTKRKDLEPDMAVPVVDNDADNSDDGAGENQYYYSPPGH